MSWESIRVEPGSEILPTAIKTTIVTKMIMIMVIVTIIMIRIRIIVVNDLRKEDV